MSAPAGDLPRELRLPDGRRFLVRSAEADDAEAVVRVLRDAFEVWARQGLRLSPMTQTVPETRAQLRRGAVVAEDASGAVVATFGACEGTLLRLSGGSLGFSEETGAPLAFAPTEGAAPPCGPVRVFKRAAVRRALAGGGLGRRLYDLAEASALQDGVPAMALETVREAAWLYDWYRRLGFEAVGTRHYPGSAVQTVLMAKKLQPVEPGRLDSERMRR